MDTMLRAYTFTLMRPADLGGDEGIEDLVFPSTRAWGSPYEAVRAAEQEVLDLFGSDGQDHALHSLMEGLRRAAPGDLMRGKEHLCEATDIFVLRLYGLDLVP